MLAEGDHDNRYQPFVYLAAPNAQLYRALLRTFADAKRQFVVHLRQEDVADRIATAARADASPLMSHREVLAGHLQQLVEWGNLRADQDNSRVATVEEFHRARYLYQLTRAGEAAERALEAFDEQLGRSGALQAVALADVESRLRQLLRLADEPQPDPGEVAQALHDLVQRSTDLADNAQAFIGSLQSAIDLHGIELETFVGYRDQLIEYLERFLRQLMTVGGSIAALLPQLDDHAIGQLLRIAAERDAQDAVPMTGNSGDATPESDPDRDRASVDAAEGLWRERWHGLHRWFVADDRHESQAQLLRQRARSAIPQLLTAIARINERREGHSDRAADFTALARWFGEAPSDRDAHRLWRVAFGLSPSRHLAIDPDTLRERRETPIAPRTPWALAPPLRISPQLRRTGSYERRGRPNRVLDRSEQRRVLAARAAAEAAQTEQVRRRLLTDGTVRLSALGEIDAEAFPLFLSLLGDALAARLPGCEDVDTATADGALRVYLRPTDDGRQATIRAARGTLRGPDHHVRIERARG